ncbi:MAG: hypothetical protein JW971_08760 [Synergistales bacterium]|nr:hypothetical protein [Synergistales bacterium]
MAHYPHFKIEGNPYERGIAYGRRTAELIEISIWNYSKMFEAFSDLTWSDARKRSLDFLPSIEAYTPDLLDEMKGIAEGSGLTFEDILTLNSRSEIVLDTSVDGCTAFGVTPEFSSEGKTYICQNWDWIRRQKDTLVVIEIAQEPSPSILMIAEAGIISGKGLNSSGLGVCFNALSTGQGKPGIPVHVLLRRILDSKTLGDAVESVASAERASSGNFLIGTSEGEIINIESAPEDFGVLYAEKGYLAHTNHFLCINHVCNVKDHGKVILPDTFHRLGRIKGLLENKKGSVDFNTCHEFLSDHRNFPDSICRHEDQKDPQGKQLASVYSAIMDLKERQLWLTSTNPCSGDFESYTFL